MIKAVLKNYRQSPRKVRLVAATLRGRKVSTALDNLNFVVKRATHPIKKLIESAAANAKNTYGLEMDDLFIKSITVDGGASLKRWRPRARGAAFQILKRTSHITVVLDGQPGTKLKKVSKKAVKVAEGDAPKAAKTAAPALPKAPKIEAKGATRDKGSAHKVQAPRTTHK